MDHCDRQIGKNVDEPLSIGVTEIAFGAGYLVVGQVPAHLAAPMRL